MLPNGVGFADGSLVYPLLFEHLDRCMSAPWCSLMEWSFLILILCMHWCSLAHKQLHRCSFTSKTWLCPMEWSFLIFIWCIHWCSLLYQHLGRCSLAPWCSWSLSCASTDAPLSISIWIEIWRSSSHQDKDLSQCSLHSLCPSGMNGSTGVYSDWAEGFLLLQLSLFIEKLFKTEHGQGLFMGEHGNVIRDNKWVQGNQWYHWVW